MTFHLVLVRGVFLHVPSLHFQCVYMVRRRGLGVRPLYKESVDRTLGDYVMRENRMRVFQRRRAARLYDDGSQACVMISRTEGLCSNRRFRS